MRFKRNPINPKGNIVKPFLKHGCRVVWIRFGGGGEEDEMHETEFPDSSPFLFGKGSKTPIVDSLDYPSFLRTLFHYKAFAPRTTSSRHTGCSVSPVFGDGGKPTGAWAGWSHRAICVFTPGTGDRIFLARPKGPIPPGFHDWDQVPFRLHGDLPVVTEADAKKAATAFARDIS